MSDSLPPVPRPDESVAAPAVPVVPAPVVAEPAAVAPKTLRVVGALILLAGILHVLSYFAPFELAILLGLMQSLALVGVFVIFVRAGFPHRGTLPRVVSIALIVVYALAGVSLLAAGSPAFIAITILLGLLTLALGVTFGIVTMRTPGISPRIARLPIGLYLALFLLGQASSRMGEELAGILPALAYLLVGVMFMAFANRAVAEPVAAPAPPVG